MTHFVKLTSEKYVAESMADEARMEAKAKRKKTIGTLTATAWSLALFAITLFVAMNMLDWMDLFRNRL